MTLHLEPRDLLFLVDTLMPGRDDAERTAELICDDEQLLNAMLDDDRLFQRLMSAEDALLNVSPRLFFAVLLRRVRRDLEQEAFTVERRHRQKIFLFDTDQVIELLDDDSLRDYLATMLASFTRVKSRTVRIRVRKGIWRRIRTSELDVEGLMRTSQELDERQRFEPYRRIADVCLFLAGMFPEYIDAQRRYPMSRELRPRARGRVVSSLDDYEAHGRAFYRLAAQHQQARAEGLNDVLATLSDNFILAEKPLTFLSSRYLQLTRHALFEL